jgi:hypothetical protein
MVGKDKSTNREERDKEESKGLSPQGKGFYSESKVVVIVVFR